MPVLLNSLEGLKQLSQNIKQLNVKIQITDKHAISHPF
jgi:hypothetical protein